MELFKIFLCILTVTLSNVEKVLIKGISFINLNGHIHKNIGFVSFLFIKPETIRQTSSHVTLNYFDLIQTLLF